MRAAVRSALLLAVVVGVAGCATPRPSGATVIELSGARATVPAGWASMTTDPAQWETRPTIALISNRPLAPVCDGEGPTRACTSPAGELEAGQLLVWWLSRTCAGPACSLPDGERRLVGGREAVELADVSTCDGMSADRQQAILVAVSPQRTDALVICQRGTDAAANALLDELLEGIEWRTP